MFKYGQKAVAFRGFMLAGALASLAGCGGSHGSAADTASVSTGAGTPAETVPSAPTGLAAMAGNAQVSLTWSASSGATSYHVKRATTSGGPYTQVGGPSSASYTDTALTNGTTYYYVVSALDSAGESDNSAEVNAEPVAPAASVTIPAAPSGLAATPGNAQVSLSWSASSGATSYHVKRSTTSGGAYTQVGAPTAASYADTSAANGTTYYYVVSALDSAGESANSAEVSAKPVAPPPAVAIPAAPTGLSANSGNAQATVAWSSSSGATGYHVKRATTSGGPYTQVGAPTSTSYNDTAVTNGTTYYYVVSALNSAGESANSAQVSAMPVVPSSTANTSACGMQLADTPAIFCETFDAPAGIGNGNRSGDLNGNVWGVSHTTGFVNFGSAAMINLWGATQIEKCDGTTPTVTPPNDIIICNGQLREALNDNVPDVFDEGGVNALTMYPKQPFDFAGRTGTVSFDVSNDTNGSHAAWPEFWVTDAPVPAPFTHFASWKALPANGFGIRLYANADPGSYGACPNGNNINQLRWTVGTVVVSRNYVLDDSDGYGINQTKVTWLDCVIMSSGPGQMNHVEIRISQNQIDVYATDAGVAPTPATLKHIAAIYNANLTLTRGLIWIEDAHYNADKGDNTRPSQREHTFAWDNVAFDGPFVGRDFSYDAPDNTTVGQNGAISLGKLAAANQTSSWSIAGLPANRLAAAAKVLFNFTSGAGPNPTTLNVTVNGNVHSVPWPYPENDGSSWRTYAVTIPITDLVTGTNTVLLGANADDAFSNVDIVLADVPNAVPVLPGSNNNYPN